MAQVIGYHNVTVYAKTAKKDKAATAWSRYADVQKTAI